MAFEVPNQWKIVRYGVGKCLDCDAETKDVGEKNMLECEMVGNDELKRNLCRACILSKGCAIQKYQLANYSVCTQKDCWMLTNCLTDHIECYHRDLFLRLYTVPCPICGCHCSRGLLDEHIKTCTGKIRPKTFAEKHPGANKDYILQGGSKWKGSKLVEIDRKYLQWAVSSRGQKHFTKYERSIIHTFLQCYQPI